MAAFVLGGLVSVLLLALRRVSRAVVHRLRPGDDRRAPGWPSVFPVQVLTGAS